jgi:hypothetical protein
MAVKGEKLIFLSLTTVGARAPYRQPKSGVFVKNNFSLFFVIFLNLP